LFGKLASAARFSQGLDLERDETLRDLAIGAGLDDAALLVAAETRSSAPIVPNDVAAVEQVFGVPTFVYKGQLFWGNDRIEWLVRAITADTDR
jgi:2-hydroxychromene-2-carboxylate isomerase